MLQAVHLVTSGAVTLPGPERDEVEGLLADTDPARSLGLHGLEPEPRRAAVVAGLGRWRERSSDPLANPLTVAVADTMARLYERLYVAA